MYRGTGGWSKKTWRAGRGIRPHGDRSPVVRVASLAARGPPDPRQVDPRALVLADAAPDAQVGDHHGDLHRFPPFPGALLEDDRLFRGRAMLLADDAGGPLREGDAPGGVDERPADDDLLLFRPGECFAWL